MKNPGNNEYLAIWLNALKIGKMQRHWGKNASGLKDPRVQKSTKNTYSRSLGCSAPI
jgi:hypothetical protein